MSIHSICVHTRVCVYPTYLCFIYLDPCAHVGISLESFELTYLQRFVNKVSQYFNDPALQELLSETKSRAREAALDAVEVLHKKCMLLCFDVMWCFVYIMSYWCHPHIPPIWYLPVIKLEVVIQSPVIVIPRGPHSQRALLIHLGNIAIHSSFFKVLFVHYTGLLVYTGVHPAPLFPHIS